MYNLSCSFCNMCRMIEMARSNHPLVYNTTGQLSHLTNSVLVYRDMNCDSLSNRSVCRICVVGRYLL